MFKNLRDDILSIRQRDPAARSALEVALLYPGFHALILHRLAHRAWINDWRLLARAIGYFSRWLTGIEIHPGATIGRRVFIDHGTGLVIGETAEVGDDVTLYQGVTLGGVSLEKGKRHPTLMNGVIVGAGAQVLGPVTVGEGARVGSNAVAVRDVAPGTTVVGIPAKAVEPRAKPVAEFASYGMPCNETGATEFNDPLARTLSAVLDEVSALKCRVAELEAAIADKPKTPRVRESAAKPVAQVGS
jgi:serine O-acetyltransferase